MTTVGSINFHCVIPDDENGTAMAFYRALFTTWQFRAQPPNQFWEITGPDGLTPQTAFLAIMSGAGAPSSPLQYYTVDDIDAYLALAQELGAPVIVPKTSVPGVGYFAELLDPLKHAFGLWESDPPGADDVDIESIS